MALKQREVPADTQNISAAQLSANQSNAQHSTGPTSPGGKARVAQNARKHGLFARDVMEMLDPKPEQQAEFEELHADLVRSVGPEDRRERDMVKRLASLTWRLDMINRKLLRALNAPFDTYDPWMQVKFWEALGRVEARTSREATQINRDLAFLQRYRIERQERIVKLDKEIEDLHGSRASYERAAERLREETDRLHRHLELSAKDSPRAAQVLASMEAERAAQGKPKGGTEAAGGVLPKVNQKEVDAWIAYNEQLRREAAAKQTQSASDKPAEAPPKPANGSSDLT